MVSNQHGAARLHHLRQSSHGEPEPLNARLHDPESGAGFVSRRIRASALLIDESGDALGMTSPLA